MFYVSKALIIWCAYVYNSQEMAAVRNAKIQSEEEVGLSKEDMLPERVRKITFLDALLE